MIIARKNVRIPALIACRSILLGGPVRFGSFRLKTYVSSAPLLSDFNLLGLKGVAAAEVHGAACALKALGGVLIIKWCDRRSGPTDRTPVRWVFLGTHGVATFGPQAKPQFWPIR